MPAHHHKEQGRIISTQTKSCDNKVCITESIKYDYKGSAEWSDQKPPVIIGINAVEFLIMISILFVAYNILLFTLSELEQGDEDRIVNVSLSAVITFLFAMILYAVYMSYF